MAKKHEVDIMTRGFGYVLTVLITLAAFAVPAHAATFTVTADALDVLDGANGSCALREAITNVNDGAATYADCVNTGAAYGTGDTIILPEGVYRNDIASTNEDLNANGDLDLLANVTITGAGAATTTINGNGIDRVLYVPAGVTVSISGVTIKSGLIAGLSGGGGIYNLGTMTISNSTISGNSAFVTSGIVNGGTMTITNSTISGNSSERNASGIQNNGTMTITGSAISGNSATVAGSGGMDNNGTLTITNSTISGNSASGQAPGGIKNNGTLTITNSTISGNSGQYGGFWVISGPATITNATITNNTGTAGAGGIERFAGSITLNNTIVADQAAGVDCSGAITSNDYNLDSDNSCAFAQPHDVPGSALANLGALASNGGSTQTHALLAGSAAIDAGDCDGGAVTDDQRGTSRPRGAGCDIGAYELTVAPTAATNAATGVGQYGATLNGTVNDNGASTVVTFHYGPTAAYGTTVTATQSPLAVGSGSTAVSKTIAGLDCGTLYHFRVNGVNGVGTTYGTDKTFTTSACDAPAPPPTPEPTPEPEPTPTNDSVTPPNPADPASYVAPTPTGNGGASPTAPVLVDPANGATVDSLIVTFNWSTPTGTDPGKLMSYLYICETDDFAGCESPYASDDGTETVDLARALGATSVVMLFGLLGWRRGWTDSSVVGARLASPSGRASPAPTKAAMLLCLLLAAGGLALASCGPSDGGSAKRAVAVTHELSPSTTYYWKVMDLYTGGGVMVSETRSFTTPAQ